MQYDIALKVLLESAKIPFFRKVLGIPVNKAEILELPQETTSIKRTDYPVLIKNPKTKEKIVYLIEFQTKWEDKKVYSLIQYKMRYMEKFGLPVRVVLVLFNPSKKAVDKFHDKEISFHFRLVKFWELDPEKFLESEEGMLPLIPLMKGGAKYVKEIERKLYESKSENKLDLLTIFDILLGMRDTKLATEFWKRRRDLMIESPIYDLIREEGIAVGELKGKLEGELKGKLEGKLEGKLDDARKMLAKGADLEFIFDITGLSEDDLRKAGII